MQASKNKKGQEETAFRIETTAMGAGMADNAPSKIWQSRLSWRITLAVFATMVIVQGAILAIRLPNIETERLSELKELARSAIVPVMENAKGQDFVSPITKEKSKDLIATTIVNGIAIYGLDLSLLEAFGETTLIRPTITSSHLETYRSVDKTKYEVVFASSDLGRPYTITASLDSSMIQPLLKRYINESLIILFLMSAFVTTVLMIALGQWLLEPILLLRSNLLNAARNPEKPDIQTLPMSSRDEIGVAVEIANDLIRQNALNLKRLKSQAEDRIHKLAYFDSLTGLPNRIFFLDKLEESIKQHVIEQDKRLTVISVDLDHFKDINDTMGHEIGDKLLEAVGKRLVKAAPEGSIIARASADEFIILSYLDDGIKESSEIVDSIFASLIEPISILQERFQVRTSIGVAHCPEDGMEAGNILKNADIALNRAKQEGRDTVRYYSEDFDRAVQQRFQLLRDLRIALDEGQLKLNYHPQFDLTTGELVGAEALLRWWRPDNSKEGGTFIPPVEFIPIAEQSSLIVPIGEWVLRTACKMNKVWQDRGLPPFRVAVNISGVQFHRGDIVKTVYNILKETELDPKWLELEVTESVFMENMDTAIRILDELHALGVELAVDDFGTGYSSLSYLRQFPIDRLKIDQSFIRSAIANTDDRTIARTIINLGHSLGLKVIAEGVETMEHEAFLKEDGCDEVQGFKYTKPIPADKFWDFARAYTGNLQKPNIAL